MFSIVLCLPLFMLSASSEADTIKIGLRAHHGIEKSMQQWKQTADYLSEKIPEHKFIFVPFIGLTELMKEAQTGGFDFVLTNPSSYVGMELELGASAILTLRNKRQGQPYTKFGSVIFTRANNKNINGIEDLKGKRFIAVSKPAFGGWRVAVRELLNEGFDVYKEASKVSFSGGIQQDVVSIISLGNADVGVVRTDMLERMATAGLIKLADFKIINKATTDGFPFVHSTRLYPEWPFVKMPKTSSTLSKKVALALLTIPSSHSAAMAGKYIGWTVPEDYRPVHDLMKDLKVGPYKHFHENPIDHFMEDYKFEAFASLFIIIGLIFMAFYVLATNRKLVAAKQEQDKIMDVLEERVLERTHDLEIAKDVAEKANQAKTEFLSRMSHELRTPMNAILGFAQIIEYDITNNNTSLIQDNVDEILVAGRHLLDLVNDVLDLAKIESGKYDLEKQEIIVSESINNVVKLLNVLAKNNLVNLYCEFESEELIVLADLRSFKQCLINVITNAIKYNKVDGDVNIITKQLDNGYCEIKVVDTGEGIAEDALEKIFEPFERVSNRSTIEGSGVGLSITKNLIEIMGGTLSVESRVGVGSTFTLLLKSAD